jgi:hypothetical protein
VPPSQAAPRQGGSVSAANQGTSLGTPGLVWIVDIRATGAEAVDDECPDRGQVVIGVVRYGVGAIFEPIGSRNASAPGHSRGDAVRLELLHPDLANVGNGFRPTRSAQEVLWLDPSGGEQYR